ncbi:MAG: archaemetzincin family Zn-dependent metalloprotease [Promethearchaeota archaeon]
MKQACLNIVLFDNLPAIHSHYLENEIKKFFHDEGLVLNVITSDIHEHYTHMFNRKRQQYASSYYLRYLALNKDFDSRCFRLGIIQGDLYSDTNPALNFIFGEAQVGKNSCVISICRLRPEFYGSSPDPDLLNQRILKEAIHELGHVLGLMHCKDPSCLMYFSNTIWDSDKKNISFCRNCKDKLHARLHDGKISLK